MLCMKKLHNRADSIFGIVLFVSVCFLFTDGCSRKSSDTVTVSSQANTKTNQVIETASPAPLAQPSLTAAPIVQPDGQPNLVELNRVARLWMIRNHRRPTGWDDFAAHAGVQIPPPPPGKKYLLSTDMRVTLVNH